jgi:hypothetical protein
MRQEDALAKLPALNLARAGDAAGKPVLESEPGEEEF